MSVILKYATFDEFLNATYDVNAVYIDTLSGNLITFKHMPGYCKDPCNHTINKIKCNGTAIEINTISKLKKFENIICSFPSESDRYKDRFIQTKSSNNRW